MFCPFCGLEIYDHATICTWCGMIINLPVEMTETEIRRLRNDYEERFGNRARVEKAIRSIEHQAEYIPPLYSARAFAFILDIGIVVGIAILLANQMRQTRELAILLVLVIMYFYFSLLTALSGRTVGKFITGMKVIDENSGEHPSLQTSLGRTMGMFVSFMFLMMGFLAPFFDAKSRSWHDILSGTLVIYKR